MNIRRFIFSLFLAIMAGLGVTGSLLFLDAHAEYSRLVQLQVENQQHLNEAVAKLHSEERVLERLRTDPAFVERVIRRKLGYAKPGEYIFRFKE